jgi:large subunit ribosomal protein L22
MKVEAKLNNLRISPRKVRLVAGLIKGLDVAEALIQLENTVKRSSPIFEKLLKSAVANAENNFGLDRDNLYIFNIETGEKAKLKRWMPRAYGRASQILKRTSVIKLTLEERIEGKGRKTKEQMEKIKKEREEARKKMEKEAREEREKSEKEEVKSEKEVPFREKREEEEKKKTGGKGWMKKVFQRKSG